MPVNGFSIGKDITLSVTNPLGNVSTVGLTNFKASQMQTDIKSKRLDGKTYFAQIPDGWSGSFRIDRLSNAIDVFFDNLEQGYYAGQNNPAGTIQMVITEADASSSTWRFDGVVLKYDDSGNWQGDARVEQSISFMATSRTKVS